MARQPKVTEPPAATLAPQRQAAILERVTQRGGVRVSELTRLLGVSDMTIRRDLDNLARQGLLTKVHGGATPVQSGSSEEPTFETKSVRELPEKRAIAQLAAALPQPGAAIALTAGSTTWVLAGELAAIPGLTVVTNSTRVAEVLYQNGRSDQTVVLTGGVRTPSDALVGPVSVATIRSLHFDMVFMGVHGIDFDAGLTTPNLMEAETNRAFVAATRQLVVVADHTKLGVVGLSQFAAVSDIDLFITDRVPADVRPALSELVGEILESDPATGPATGPEGGRR